MTDFPPERPSRRSRPNHLAAPPLTQPKAAFEGLDILAEIDGPTGVLLAGASRDVMLWVETTPRDRAPAFGVDAGVHRSEMVRSAEIDETLRHPLSTLARKMGEVEPGRGDEDVLLACQEIESWADLQGFPATRLAFAQACALFRPHDAKLALIVARLSRDLGQTDRAESWFRHAVRLARNRDNESYGWAFIGLGVMFMRSGNFPGAYAVMTRALRHGERQRLREIASVSHHHLFRLAVEYGHLREAYAHAHAALELYGKAHPRLRDLAGDVGRFWVHLGEFNRALPVLEAVVEGYPDPNGRAMGLAIIGYAAAASGNVARFETARDGVEECLRDAIGTIRLAETQLFVAWANLAVCDWTRAEDAARKCHELAIANGEAENKHLAEAALEQARTQEIRSRQLTILSESPNIVRQAESLAGNLVIALLDR